MKRIIIAATALLMGCAGTTAVTKDVCEEFRTSIPDNKTLVVRSEKEFNTYMYSVGGAVAYKHASKEKPCANINVHMSWINQTLKGEFCIEKRLDGTYLCENVCEYTQDEVTNRSLDVCHKLGL